MIAMGWAIGGFCSRRFRSSALCRRQVGKSLSNIGHQIFSANPVIGIL